MSLLLCRSGVAVATTALVSGLLTAAVSLPSTAAPVAPARAPAAAASVAGLPSQDTVGVLEVENSFVSAVGWVKPGETYPSRIIATNPGDAALTGSIAVTAPKGSRS